MDQSMKLSQKNFENWWFWKLTLFDSAILEFFLQFFFSFLCFIPMKISHKLCDRIDGNQFWCFLWFPGNSLLCVILCYTLLNSSLWLKQTRLVHFMIFYISPHVHVSNHSIKEIQCHHVDIVRTNNPFTLQSKFSIHKVSA